MLLLLQALKIFSMYLTHQLGTPYIVRFIDGKVQSYGPAPVAYEEEQANNIRLSLIHI